MSNSVEKKLAKEFKVETWRINWTKEFQADEFALMLAIRLNHHLKDMEAEISYLGVPFFFTTIDILYKAIGQEFSETHPSPIQRIEILEESLYRDTEDKELVDDMKRVRKMVIQLIYQLWEQNKETILKSIDDFKQQPIVL